MGRLYLGGRRPEGPAERLQAQQEESWRRCQVGKSEGQTCTVTGKKAGVNKRGCMSIPTGQGYIPLHAYSFSVAFHKYILELHSLV